MDFSGDIDFFLVFDMFILLLIGMGPKVALVPFLDLTKGMEGETQRKVARQMVRTAVTVALLLVVLGGFLMKLLHFTPGALSIAGGIVFMLLALHMVVGAGKSNEHDEEKAAGRDPMQMALYPLAVPYLLNPAGIAVIVIASGDANSLPLYAILIRQSQQAVQTPGPLPNGGDGGGLWRAAGRFGRAVGPGWAG
jgi:multiple antibiotic resistance protein